MVSGWQDKKRDKPAPGQETRLGIMPGCHKRENDPNIAHGRSHAAQRHVHITNQSQVETPVLTPPESQSRIVVDHISNHVLGCLNTVGQRPNTEESPDEQQLEPDQDQVKKPNHTNLKDRVVVPGLRLADRHHVHVMDGEFHRRQRKDEPGHPHHQNSHCDRFWVPQLMEHGKGTGELMEEKI